MRKRNNVKPIIRRVLLIVTAATAIGVASSPLAQTNDRKAQAAYEEAQKQLNDERYDRAASGFQEVFKEYDDSKYAGDAIYWYAFALYRIGGKSNLGKASDALETHMKRYSNADSRDDASALYYRVLGELARNGDEQAASKLEEAKENLDTIGHDMETKLMAMEALINMSSERAMPILRTVMANKSDESVPLRVKAVFLLSQQESEESVQMLIDAAKNDPDQDVREKAVFWLSQVSSDKAIDFLEQILKTAGDPSVREKAVFAISQHGSERSMQILRRLALDPETDRGVREKAIFWLGQEGNDDNLKLLMGLYDKLEDDELKDKVIFSVSQGDSPSAVTWLTRIAMNKNGSVEQRKHALFWASQEGYIGVKQLLDLYQGDDKVEFREQVIFALSQRSEPEALDAMMDLARKEKDTKLRKKLIFWIGQSDDPRATKFLVDIINE